MLSVGRGDGCLQADVRQDGSVLKKKEDELGSRYTWVQVLVVTLTDHVTLGKPLSILWLHISP
jgi:hypothetical protein